MADPIQLDAQQITGTTYVRCSQIMCTNPLNCTPLAVCYEDLVTLLSTGETTVHPSRVLQLPYDPSASIPILDPTTGQQVSTMPMPQVFAILFSIYGAARAAAAQQPPP